MTYYQHNRSNSLLQRAYMLRNNTLSLSANDNPDRLKRENSQKQINTSSILEASKNNNSYYDLESFKDKILSPEDTIDPKYNTPIKTKSKEMLYNTIGRSSFISRSTTEKARKTLILDLDETLVHSSFRSLPYKADIELQIAFDGVRHKVYVMKRPYVDEFLLKMNELYDIFIFTASISPYANPLLDKLDKNRVIKKRLFREHCKGRNGAFIKDLSVVTGKELKDMILLDNNPISFSVNQLNGLPILTWHDDKNDTELLKLIPFLEYMASTEDVRRIISKVVLKNKVDYNKVTELIAVSQLHTPKKRDSKGNEAQILRSKSSTSMNYDNNAYESKLQEWIKLKEKMNKKLEEQHQQRECNVRAGNNSNSNMNKLIDKSVEQCDNKQRITLVRKNPQNNNPTIVKTSYNTDKRMKYNQNQQDLHYNSVDLDSNTNRNQELNYNANTICRHNNNGKNNTNSSSNNNNQMYFNSPLTFLQAQSNYNTIDHSTNIYQSSSTSTFYSQRPPINTNTNNKELKRNTSCTCFSTNQNYYPDNNYQQQHQHHHQQEENNSFLRATPIKANHPSYYESNEEEEEKTIFNRISYNTYRSINATPNTNIRRRFNPEAELKQTDYSNNENNSKIYSNSSNRNYYSLRRMMMNRKGDLGNNNNYNNRIEAQVNNRYNGAADDSRMTINANSNTNNNNNKRLLFNSATIGNDYYYGTLNHDYNTEFEGYSIKQREYNMSNTFYNKR